MSIVTADRPATPVYCHQCGRFLVERRIGHEGRTRLQCEACGFIHYLNPRVVTSVIVEHAGRLLLQQRAMEPGRGLWTFPGGFLEVGETPESGAVRETREEVGLEVELRGLLGVYSRPHAGIVLVVYEGESESSDAVVGDEESLTVRWFAPGELPWGELAFDTTKAALADWVARHAAPGAATA
jgi:ADP-ribose pyrophosphatase YjhB (NUDIX family)